MGVGGKAPARRDRTTRRDRILRDEHLARVDPGAGLQEDAALGDELVVQVGDRLPHLDRRTNGAKRVVLVHGRDAEHRDEVVGSREACGRPPVPLHGGPNGREVAIEHGHGAARDRGARARRRGRRRSRRARSTTLREGRADGAGSSTACPARSTRAGARSDSSCRRIACSSSRSWSAGSIPSSSTSIRRTSWYVSSASACRPQRYSASISCARGRSLYGWAATSASRSATTSRCRPSASSASTSSSRAVSSSSSSLAICALANGSNARSASGGPRRSASASRSCSERSGRRSVAALHDLPLEAHGVDLLGREVERIAGGQRRNRLAAELLPQLRHVVLERVGRAAGRLLPPEILDERVLGNRPPDPQRECREQGARLLAVRRQDMLAVDDVELTEQSDLEHAAFYHGRRTPGRTACRRCLAASIMRAGCERTLSCRSPSGSPCSSSESRARATVRRRRSTGRSRSPARATAATTSTR